MGLRGLMGGKVELRALQWFWVLVLILVRCYRNSAYILFQFLGAPRHATAIPCVVSHRPCIRPILLSVLGSYRARRREL
jgi:hypothetical protein